MDAYQGMSASDAAHIFFPGPDEELTLKRKRKAPQPPLRPALRRAAYPAAAAAPPSSPPHSPRHPAPPESPAPLMDWAETTCRRCHGAVYTEGYKAENGRHRDAICMMCGATNASLQPGTTVWTEWIAPGGRRVLPKRGTRPDVDEGEGETRAPHVVH